MLLESNACKEQEHLLYTKKCSQTNVKINKILKGFVANFLLFTSLIMEPNYEVSYLRYTKWRSRTKLSTPVSK